MKTQAIVPAEIDFGTAPGQPPRSTSYGDIYHPQVGALEQAAHVFLQGNGLPVRWAGRARFTILETGFGLGNNFLATWDAWQRDPARCERLYFISVERHPPRHADLVRAHQGSRLPDLADALLRAWPPLTPNLHTLEFDTGRVQLLLALGDVADLLPGLNLQADAFYLDGFAPACNPAMWQPRVLRALARKAAPGATLATWSVARELRDGLTAAGFEVERSAGIGGKREISVARHAPRFELRRPPPGRTAAAGGDAVVVGAGIAGACVARALARTGLAVTVLERRQAPAAETSGHPAAVFHGSVNPDDGPHARLYRAAALQAQRDHGAAIAHGVAGGVRGLLRLDGHPGGVSALAATLRRLALPADYVQALDADAASRCAGIALDRAAWFYPGGGWLSPVEAVRAALDTPGVRLVTGAAVASLRREGALWALLDAQGLTLARAATVVLANAAGASPLVEALGHARWPLWQTRGQITHGQGIRAALSIPVAGDGYVLPLPLPGGGLLFGATRDRAEPSGTGADRAVLQADHLRNLASLQRLTGLGPGNGREWQGHVGWRLQTDDRLPVCGAMPLPGTVPGQRLDQPRLLRRQDGLFVLTALGSRGITLAPLLGRLVAAQATGTPWPLEQDLVDAIDPGRWRVRAARRAGGLDQPSAG